MRIIVALCLALVSQWCSAEMTGRYLQGMVGVLETDEVWTIKDESTGEPLAVDWGDLLYGGAAVQMNFSDSAFEYGYESGGLVSFKNDSNYLVASGSNGGAVVAEIDNEFWQVDLYMGAYVGLNLGDRFRLYVTAGPALVIGSLSVEEAEATPTSQAATVVISSSDRQTDAALGLYGKVGVEFIFASDITVGASVRQVDAELDFDEAGTMTFNQPQYFITIGKKY